MKSLISSTCKANRCAAHRDPGMKSRFGSQ